MSGHGAVHKESLPGQGHIKRRRAEPSSSSANLSASPDETASRIAKGKDTGSTEMEKKRSSTGLGSALGDQEVEFVSAREEKPMAAAAQVPSSSSSSEDDEDDDEAIARENVRLAKLRSRLGNSSSSGGTEQGSTSQAATRTGGSGASYNHDVLFRRSDWRQGTTPVDRKKARDDKWKRVVNDKEVSENYQHFMKKHFK